MDVKLFSGDSNWKEKAMDKERYMIRCEMGWSLEALESEKKKN